MRDLITLGTLEPNDCFVTAIQRRQGHVVAFEKEGVQVVFHDDEAEEVILHPDVLVRVLPT